MDPDAVAAPLPRESPPRDDDSPDAGEKDGRKRRHKEKRSHKHKSKEKKRSREKSPALPEGPSVGDGEDDGEGWEDSEEEGGKRRSRQRQRKHYGDEFVVGLDEAWNDASQSDDDYQPNVEGVSWHATDRTLLACPSDLC